MQRQVNHTPHVPDLVTTCGDGSFVPALKQIGRSKYRWPVCRFLSVKSPGHPAREVQNRTTYMLVIACPVLLAARTCKSNRSCVVSFLFHAGC
jgi:hypothetical protein